MLSENNMSELTDTNEYENKVAKDQIIMVHNDVGVVMINR